MFLIPFKSRNNVRLAILQVVRLRLAVGMMGTNVDIYKDQESGDTVTATSGGKGRLVLSFHVGTVEMAITATRNSLISASLGGRAHFASSEGACEFNRQGESLEIVAQRWRGDRQSVMVDQATFEAALRSLTETEPSRGSLF